MASIFVAGTKRRRMTMLDEEMQFCYRKLTKKEAEAFQKHLEKQTQPAIDRIRRVAKEVKNG